MNKDFSAKVIKLIKDKHDDIYQIVINKGVNDGVKVGDKVIVYEQDSEELFDPDTKESLGYMEIVKGQGKVIHVQEKISIIESNEYYITKSGEKVVEEDKPSSSQRGIMAALYSYNCKQTVRTKYIEPEKERKPFENIKLNDLVKPL